MTKRPKGPQNRRIPDLERVEYLVSQFNGLIKYYPMLQDHPDWTNEQCLAFARKHHALAKARLDADPNDPQWNDRIPYCRNDPTKGVDAK